jgi:predicted  nucleic acid-binding Zn-ribbon protein
MSATPETIQEEVLIELLLERQAYSRETVESLCQHFAGKGSYGAFAPIKGDSCGACRVKIASARLQRTNDGSFITCANCARFLYLASKVLSEERSAPTKHS